MPEPPSRSVRLRQFLPRPWVLLLLTALVLSAAVGAALLRSQPEVARLSLSELRSEIAQGQVTAVTLDDRRQVATIDLADGTEARTAYPEGFGEQLTMWALEADVDVGARGAQESSASDVLLRLLPFLLVGGILWFFLRHRLQPGGFTGQRGKQAPVPATRFDDVAGASEVTSELAEVVEYLRDPQRFSHLGARPPKGVLLIGPPGTGKTLLARAVAGEAGVPFYALSGSDFIEKFVGVGASRMRSVFDRARKGERAIVFIDEIDAIGKRRGGGMVTNDERENTLNQLLVEMDGFTETQVVVLAATNRPDTLDPALTRPGRFDRQIPVVPPDRAGREEILRLYMADRPVEAVDLGVLSRRTPGFTGADLANLVNQAAVAAARAGALAIHHRHFEDAVATVMLGRERRSLEVLERDRQITAWHEAGHTVAALVHEHAAKPAGVSIIPRGHAGGVTWMHADDHQFVLAPQASAQLVVAMAGRAAEQLVYGAAYSQGASGDLRSATGMATRMCAEYGMSPVIGPVHIPEEERAGGELADLLRRAVREMLTEALASARALLEDNRGLLEAVTEALLEHETLDSDDLLGIQERLAAAA